METIFREQQELINHFFKHLNHSTMEQFANKLMSCKGIVFLTGMGKSGIIAKNIAQMLVSTGIRAMFLDPVNALHGDVGVVCSEDIIVIFSKSGQSNELLSLLPAARNKGACLIAVVSNQDSLLARECHEIVYLPLKRELCPFDMAPTTSTIIQLAFGNTIVAYLMQKTGLTKEAYALNHPAGRIGKRLTIRVDDVMTPINNLAICKLEDKLGDCLHNMSSKRCGCLLICDNGVLCGIFTDGDLRRAIDQHRNNSVLDQIMKNLMNVNVSTTKIGEMAYDAMREMERYDDETGKKRVKELPVIDHTGKLLGLIMLHNLVEYGL